MINTKRAYEPYSPSDGYRVLVDRLWPRGLAKANAHIDRWAKDIAPSTELRQWYDHDPAKWPVFKKRYRAELKNPEAKAELDALIRRAKHGRVTLVFGAHAGDISNAAALKIMLDRRLREHRPASVKRRSQHSATRVAPSRRRISAKRSSREVRLSRGPYA